eukprot:CAMPEP_0119007870 /NCGR_PEP_ID=MMETSP1176-20130426/3307_1 /TAXON_ID=265551 /ORGANISM="Synedropsis recta cf, Strain CCMP1620" /LENGTH=631 /DNA_ID=CAMNT_0006960103 /DNA_START=258 /DNA_END=2153 /DNA_ORIENTATION=-
MIITSYARTSFAVIILAALFLLVPTTAVVHGTKQSYHHTTSSTYAVTPGELNNLRSSAGVLVRKPDDDDPLDPHNGFVSRRAEHSPVAISVHPSAPIAPASLGPSLVGVNNSLDNSSEDSPCPCGTQGCKSGMGCNEKSGTCEFGIGAPDTSDITNEKLQSTAQSRSIIEKQRKELGSIIDATRVMADDGRFYKDCSNDHVREDLRVHLLRTRKRDSQVYGCSLFCNLVHYYTKVLYNVLLEHRFDVKNTTESFMQAYVNEENNAAQYEMMARFGCPGLDYTKSLKCMQDGIENVKTLYELGTSLWLPSSEKCNSETMEIELYIKTDWAATNIEKTSFNTGESNHFLEYVDYSTNKANNKAYENACVTAGGEYVELNYTAQCEQFAFESFVSECSNDCDINEDPTMTIIAVATRHPRCYSKWCKSSDHHALFEQYTLRLTEERALIDFSGNRDDTIWRCTGDLGKQEEGTTCKFETMHLSHDENLEDAFWTVKQPGVAKKKIAWVIPTADKIVTFKDSVNLKAYKLACEEDAGGLYKKMDSSFTCFDGDEQYRFDVSNLPVCLGKSCTSETTADEEMRIAESFKGKMIQSRNLDAGSRSLHCVMSRATLTSGSSMVFAAIGTVGAVMWNWM